MSNERDVAASDGSAINAGNRSSRIRLTRSGWLIAGTLAITTVASLLKSRHDDRTKPSTTESNGEEAEQPAKSS